ncbi:coenzyme F420-0:L-glutamate ligase [Patescibacteria group bacterium]
MNVNAIKTPLVKKGDDLFKVITMSVDKIPEKSVLVIASKIISFCQHSFVKKTSLKREEKHKLIKKEADFYLEPHSSKYNLMFTIKNSVLAINAGIDESNANGDYVLWPKDLQLTTNKIWRFLKKQYSVKNIGVIVTDSKALPLRWGVIGMAISHCGFKSLYDYENCKDLFGRRLKMTKINVTEAIAVAAALEMGEVAERTPLGLVQNIKKIEFQNRPPTKKELASLTIDKKDDVYGPLLNSVKWKKGKNKGNF